MGGFTDLESLPEGPMDRNHSLEEINGGCLLTTLKNVVISYCTALQLPMNRRYSSLETLDIIDSCNSLVSFRLDIFPKLYHLKIKGCSNINSLSDWLSVSEGLDLLSLEIENCPNFVDLSSGGILAPNLLKLIVKNCPHLKSLPKNMGTDLLSLEYLEISNCPQLESFSEGGLPSNLIHFRIGDCEKLISTRKDWGLQALRSLKTLLFLNLDPDCQDVESFPKDNSQPPIRILRSLKSFFFPSAKSKSETPTPTPRFPHSNVIASLIPDSMSSPPSFLQAAITNDPYFTPALPLSIPSLFPPCMSESDTDSSEVYENRQYSYSSIFPPTRSEDDSDSSENNEIPVPNLLSTGGGSSANNEIPMPNLFPSGGDGSENNEIMPNLSVPSSSQASSVESFPEVDLLPASLVNLGIAGFRNLRSLENKGFQHLTSLQQLFIVNCPELEHLPEEGLPATVSLLQINKCPLLMKQLKRKKGKMWRNIARIPFIRMDDQEPKVLARSTT